MDSNRRTPEIITYTFEELEVTSEMIKEILSNNDTEMVPDSLNEELEQAIQLGSEKCDVVAGYFIDEHFEVDQENKCMRSSGITFETNKVVTRQMKGSEKAAWYMCTAGKNISSFVNELMQQGDFMKGYALDILANILLDRAMERTLNSITNKMATQSYKVTNFYNPGYCDWDIKEQKKLFSLFPDNFLGISLTESSLMVPIKSTSGVIGIGKDVKFNTNTCNYCNNKNCVYRHRKNREKSPGFTI